MRSAHTRRFREFCTHLPSSTSEKGHACVLRGGANSVSRQACQVIIHDEHRYIKLFCARTYDMYVRSYIHTCGPNKCKAWPGSACVAMRQVQKNLVPVRCFRREALKVVHFTLKWNTYEYGASYQVYPRSVDPRTCMRGKFEKISKLIRLP